MKIAQNIDMVMQRIEDSGFSTRIVGGAVRDFLLGITPKDIDLATDALPHQVMEMFSDFNVIPTGLDHGTVTVVVDQEPIEITTLRVDVVTDGRHAEVEFTTHWEQDAARRDLTINAMSMDRNGNLFDYFDGENDLKAKVVKFVGDADTRIKEDYLRILRAFRFAARFKAGFDTDTMISINRNVSGLKQISGERIWNEIQKIFASQDLRTLQTMESLGVLEAIGLRVDWISSATLRTSDHLIVLADMMVLDDVDRLFKAWKFDANTRDILQFLNETENAIVDNPNAWDMKKYQDLMAVDQINKDWVIRLAILVEEAFVKDLKEWEIPVFPVRGADLLDKGMKPGPAVGQELDRLKKIWAQSNFSLTKANLLAEIA